jgi:hypothetical protein
MKSSELLLLQSGRDLVIPGLDFMKRIKTLVGWKNVAMLSDINLNPKSAVTTEKWRRKRRVLNWGLWAKKIRFINCFLRCITWERLVADLRKRLGITAIYKLIFVLLIFNQFKVQVIKRVQTTRTRSIIYKVFLGLVVLSIYVVELVSEFLHKSLYQDECWLRSSILFCTDCILFIFWRLCYKPEGRGFDSRWGHWIFQFT